MENLFDMSAFEKNFKDYKIEGEIDKYTFRASKKWTGRCGCRLIKAKDEAYR